MAELMDIGILSVVVTLSAFLLGQKLQQRFRTPILNPILIAVILVLGFLALTGIPVADYKADMNSLSWLLTPATVCLAVPMYEQLQILKKKLPMILAGVAAGTVSCLVTVAVFCTAAGFDSVLTASLLPKSITTAIGVVLSEMMGGLPGITTASIILTGIFASITGPALCRLFRLSHPVAKGVAFGTAGHVIATARASELDPLIGAVSSLSLVVAGLLTAVILPALASVL